ncbi:MAG: sugar transferase, partial [Deltaproteobacteria bacterium]
ASEEDALRKLEYDLYYIKNMSLRMDLGIIFMTVKTVLFQRGSR